MISEGFVNRQDLKHAESDVPAKVDRLLHRQGIADAEVVFPAQCIDRYQQAGSPFLEHGGIHRNAEAMQVSGINVIFPVPGSPPSSRARIAPGSFRDGALRAA